VAASDGSLDRNLSDVPSSCITWNMEAMMSANFCSNSRLYSLSPSCCVMRSFTSGRQGASPFGGVAIARIVLEHSPLAIGSQNKVLFKIMWCYGRGYWSYVGSVGLLKLTACVFSSSEGFQDLMCVCGVPYFYGW